MYISLKDSCARGFKKWADTHQPEIKAGTHQPEIKNDIRASRGNGLAVASTDQDNLVMTSLERPHRPWLVPGAGTL